MTPEPALPIETHPRARRARCPYCGERVVVRDGRLDWHDAAGALGRWGLYCSGSAEPASLGMRERAAETEGGR